MGPIGIRERRDLIVIDRWRFLGTARNEAEAHALLQSRRVALDSEIYRILIGALPKLPRRSIVELRRMHYCEAPSATSRIAKAIMMIVGVWTRAAGVVIAINMVVAVMLAHAYRVFTLSKTGRLALDLQGMFFFAALAVALLGAGRLRVVA